MQFEMGTVSRADKSVIRKQEILNAYHEVIVKEGLEGASIAKIARRLGIHPSLIIHYFKTKDEMLLELVEHFVNKHRDEQLSLFGTTKDPRERLEGLIELVIPDRRPNREEAGILLAFVSLGYRKEEVQARVMELKESHDQDVLTELDSCIDAGLLTENNRQNVAHLLRVFSFWITIGSPFLNESERKESVCLFRKIVRSFFTCFGENGRIAGQETSPADPLRRR